VKGVARCCHADQLKGFEGNGKGGVQVVFQLGMYCSSWSMDIFYFEAGEFFGNDYLESVVDCLGFELYYVEAGRFCL